MSQNIKLPNGNIITDVPLDITQEELKQLVIKNNLATEKDFQTSKEAEGATKKLQTVEKEKTLLYPEVPSLDKELEPVFPEVPALKQEEKKTDLSFWENFKYNYDSANTDVSNLSLIIKAAVPVLSGGIGFDGTIVTPSRVFGTENYNDLSFDERRKILLDQRQSKANEDNRKAATLYAENPNKKSNELSSFLGQVAGSLMSPTTLAPTLRLTKSASAALAGQPVLKRTAEDIGTGALYGGQYSILDQLAQEGKVDPSKTIRDAGVGGLAGLLPAGVSGVSQVAKAAVTSKPVAIITDAATVQIKLKAVKNKTKVLQEEIAERIVTQTPDVPASQIIQQAKNSLGMTNAELRDIYAYGDFQYPSAEDALKITAAKENPIASKIKLGETIDDFITPISTRIKNLSLPVFGSLRQMEFNLSVNKARYLKQSEDFIDSLTKLKRSELIGGGSTKVKENLKKFEVKLFNGDFVGAKKIASDNFPELLKPLDKIINNKTGVLPKLYKALKKSGSSVAFRENYFPRVVKDLKGLNSVLEKDPKNDAVKFLDKIALASKRTSWKELTNEEQIEGLNKFFQVRNLQAAKKGFNAQRKIETLDESLSEFYHSPSESLYMYINSAVTDIELRNFLGTKSTIEEGGILKTLDLSKSVGSKILQTAPKISQENLEKLKHLLEVRLNAEKLKASDTLINIKDIQTMVTLGQIDSAITQLGDLGSAIYVSNLAAAIKGLAKAATNKTRVNVEELGLINNITADLNSNGFFNKATDNVLKAIQFRRADKLGKETLIEAALETNAKLARTNPQKIVSEWGEIFGEDVNKLIGDLRSETISEEVKLFLFHKLSDIQPITLSEMPEKYLKMPNGRIFYALKSFTLKQLDIVRREGLSEVAKGNYSKGFKNLMSWGVTFGLVNGTVQAFKDSLLNLEMDVGIDAISDEAFESFASLLFLNKYSREKYFGEGIVPQGIDFGLGVISPPALDFGEDIGNFINNLYKEVDEDREADPEYFDKFLTDKIPLFGRVWYNWFGGGIEKRAERKKKEEQRETRKYFAL